MTSITTRLLALAFCTAASTLAVAADIAASAPPARAASAAAMRAVAGACKADLQKFCAGIEPGGGRLVQCAKEHRAELSPECKKAVMQNRG